MLKKLSINIVKPHLEKVPGQVSAIKKTHFVLPDCEVLIYFILASIRRGNEHILFVDDEESILKLGIKALERSGYQVTGINRSNEALEIFNAHPDNFDLVITDMAMPGMVGSELALEILKTRPDIPIIICSGYSEKLDRIKAKELKVSAFLDKPLNIANLVKYTRDVLDNQ